MLRHLPKFAYRGITIIMSNPSRLDRTELLSGVGGWYFNSECLQPEINRWQCDIRLIEDRSSLLPGTKVILLLGERAHRQYTGANTTLDENRGSPIIVGGIPCISSFSPQDAVDPVDHETKYHQEEYEESNNEEREAGDIIESKGRGRTARSNYRFWLKADTKKAIRILENEGRIPSHGLEPRYHIQPDIETLIDLLINTKGQDFFYDMETDFYSLDMRCFAFSFGNNPEDIYIVPTLDINYRPSYGRMQPRLIRALSIAIRDNCCVAHNGANFDFFVLAFKYGISIGNNVYDTLIANQRVFPTVEKSLGHCISYWTYEPYHKNEGVHSYHTYEQAQQLYAYCGKDVFTMYLVKKAQQEMASKDKGLFRSIELANRAIRPYLITTLTGIRYDEEYRQKAIRENDRLMMQYLRVMQSLIGSSVQPLISNKKCVEYFHNRLGYKAVARTPAGNPSLAADALYKLALNHDNPVIKFLLKYREIQKQTGILRFKPWNTI
jgi:hypothetical protein